MFQVRVVVGDYALGKEDMKDAPFKDDGVQYDSVVDDMENLQMFVVFKDVAACPEYLIKFKM